MPPFGFLGLEEFLQYVRHSFLPEHVLLSVAGSWTQSSRENVPSVRFDLFQT